MVLAADFGGDKGAVKLFKITAGKPVVAEGYSDDIQDDGGKGYLGTIERAAAYAQSQNIPFGISWGAPLEGTRPQYHPKAEISSAIVSVINDGPAGTLSGAVEAYRQHGSQDVIFVINSGGIGGSAVVNGELYACEPGHVEGIAALNTYAQTKPCNIFGATYVCMERLGANKAGIEAQWQAKTGAYMRARDIEDKYKAGDRLASDLYENSARVVAHLIVGMANAFTLDLTDPKTVVVAHGGALKFPYYGERIQQIIGKYLGAEPQFIMAKDYVGPESNACLEGAAISVVYSA